MKINILSIAILGTIIVSSCSNPSNEVKQTISGNELKGYATNIEKNTLENTDFRKVLYTSKYMQLVLMSLKPNEEIGEETHSERDQFLRFEWGHGQCIINGKIYNVKAGDVIIVPFGALHNVINTDSISDLKLYTIYTPPVHEDGIIQSTKKEAETTGKKFDGKTTE